MENGAHRVFITKTEVLRIGENMNKCVFVTGATNGTGFAIAERFAKEEWNVFVGSRSYENANIAAKNLAERYKIVAKGYKYESSPIDELAIKEIFDDIRKSGFLLDSIVLNAANLAIGQVSLDVDLKDFFEVFETNVLWNFAMAREAAKQMIEKGRGSIVFVNSNSAIRVTENRCAYCSSKSAVLAMSKSLAVDLGKYGIRSNCVLPGMIKTERWQKNLYGARDSLANRTPLGDIAEFQDVANAVWYFASDESRNTTGSELVVDGGMLASLIPHID